MNSRSHAVGEVLVDELESNLNRFVSLKDVEEETYTSDGDDNSDGYEPFGSQAVKKCHGNSSSMAPSDEEDNVPETGLQLLFPEEFPHLNSTRLPFVSAMKGSREKQGSPRKLTVSWAPDVYDPIPNSLSHSVKSKPKKSRKDRDKDNTHNKKNGKKGQKGSSSKGLGGKDKRQFRKSGGRSDKCYKTDASEGSDDFGVGSPDYCGSSFLKNSAAKFHYSVAEAL
ncbi:hypothetical protein OIU85_016226 [Salix viminalis]|uniref:Uncharacterized protein n=2 Tax=Salix TaxID=40685 RepID=A0A6N2KTG4_SALVM|nr:hypothetical protein OIU85_016226 [Salix viminalis]